MVVLLVVLTFAAFIAADYMLNREKYRVPAEERVPEAAIQARVLPAETVSGIALPAHLFFHPGHTWVAQEGPQFARVGLDEFAARLLAGPGKVLLPMTVRWIRQGEKAFAVSQDGKTVEFLSPVEGEIAEVNRELLENPTLLKSDPYGHGWLMRVKSPDLSTGLRNLLNGSLARGWMEDSLARLRQFFAPTEWAVAQDGGPLLDGLGASLEPKAWMRLQAEFFRTRE